MATKKTTAKKPTAKKPSAKKPTAKKPAPTTKKAAPKKTPAVLAFPTDAWRARMKAGDASFTEAKIAAAEKVLRAFIDGVDADPNGALGAAVKGLNAIGGFDGSMGNFIETTEREELVPFLLGAARAAGAKGKGDLTEDLREW